MDKARIAISVLLLCVTFSVFAADSIGKVIKVTGDVFAIQDDGEQRALKRGSDLYEKDKVSTNAAALVSLRFNDGTLIELASDTEYAIHNYAYNEANPDDDTFNSEILKGGFRAITGKIGTRNPTAFTAKARMTTLSIRGTQFYYAMPVSAKCIPGVGCMIVTAFVLEGGVSLETNGQVYDIGEGSEYATFEQYPGGVVQLTNVTPIETIEQYPDPIDQLEETAKAFAEMEGAPPDVEAEIETQFDELRDAEFTTTDTDAAREEIRGGAGGGGDDPCSALKAVQGAM